MARDYELRLSFSDVTAATNISAVVNDLSATNRTGLVTLTSTANQWAVGFSDALNFTHFRNQIADTTNLVSGTVTSAIVNDPALNNSTSQANYYLRASVSPVGFVGPEPCQFIVQGAQDVGTGAAPAQTASSSWSQISGVSTCPATCTAQSVGYSLASPTLLTVTAGAAPPTGTIVMFTGLGGGAGPALRVPYVAIQISATTYQLSSVLGSNTAVNAGTAGTAATTLVGTNASSLTAVSVNDAADRIAFAEPVFVGDTIMVGNAGSITGVSTGVVYYVTSVTTDGATIATTSGGTTVAIGGTAAGAFWGKINFSNLNAVFSASGTGTTITTSAPHALSVGQVVVPSAAAALGGLTNGVAYYVIATPTPTTLQVATTINGTAVAITAATNPLFVGRPPKIANAPVVATTRPWVRMGVQQLNGAAAQDGYIVVYGAEFSMGKDSSAVS